MCSGRNHSTLVGARVAPPATFGTGDVVDSGPPRIVAVGGGNVITVHVDNVVPGQVCELLHKGVISLSPRFIVGPETTSMTVASFALQRGRYELSVRSDGPDSRESDSCTVFVM